MVIIPTTAYCMAGSFCVFDFDEGRYVWHKCRETFHAAIIRHKLSQYAYHTHAKQQVQPFVEQIETHLRVPERCQWDTTNIENVLWLKPGCWWTDNEMRHNMLSIVLRGAPCYVTNNYLGILKNNKYTERTSSAVDKFMAGYTEYHDSKFSGWVSQFGGNSSIHKLVLPDLPEIRQQKLQTIAYAQWESNGKPFGQCQIFWDKAVKIYNAAHYLKHGCFK